MISSNVNSPRIILSIVFFGLLISARAAHAQLCPPGYYNPSGGLAAGDFPCPPGYYTSAPGALSPTACAAGYYQPSPAQSSQIPASPGYFVGGTAATLVTPAPAGSYASGFANTQPTQCTPGYYTAFPASSIPTAATPGHYVPAGNATGQIPASPGYFVPISAASLQTPAPPGYYTPVSGLSSVSPAAIGYFVHFSASSIETLDPVGTTTPHSASTSPRSASLTSPRGSNFIVGPIYNATPTPTIDLTGGPGALHVSNISTDLGTSDTLTALTLLSAALSGPEQADFSVNGFVADTVLFEQGATDINLSVVSPGSLSPGLHTATLTVQTDQSADYGATGQAFTYTVEFNAVPEPGALGVLGSVLMLAARRNRRVLK